MNFPLASQILPLPLELEASSVAELEIEVCLEALELHQETESLQNNPELTPCSTGELQIFASTFLTIFLAELGDKTQVTTLLMSAGSQSPWVVFAGAGAALVLTSLLGILLGRWLATRVSQKTLETSAGLTLLLISGTLFWDVLYR